jgi:DNA-directed RNA polymerase subunit beta'
MKLQKISSEHLFNPERVITNPDIYSRKREIIYEDGYREEVKEFSHDGLFSPEIFGKLDTENEYSCSCGKYIGKIYEGLECDACGTFVEKIEANIDKTAWIDLKNDHVIKYLAYMTLEKIIGRDELREITKSPSTINIEGNIDEEELNEIRSRRPENKYYQIGIRKFKENFSEVIGYYFTLKFPELSDTRIKELETDITTLKNSNTKKDKIELSELVDELERIRNRRERKLFESLEDIDNVFTNKIPVLSTVLRPAMRTSEGLKMDALNNIYINILKSVKILHDETNKSILSKIYTHAALQSQYFQLSEEIIETIKGKGGLIRNQIMGSRVNFSARNIISPAVEGYRIDEVVLPYLTFLILYKYEIISHIARIKNIHLIRAEKIWYKATLKMNEEMFLIMKKMVIEDEISILLNRNPTISYGSILYLKVAGVKHNYDDLTMSIHNGILSLLAGDYDGDVLNIVSIKDNEMKKIFKEVFSPVNLIIDSNDGSFNQALNLERDQVLGLNSLLI